MSEVRASSAGFHSEAFKSFCKIMFETVPDQSMVSLWNKYLSAEDQLKGYSEVSRKAMKGTFVDLRRVIRSRLLESEEVSERYEFTPDGMLRVRGEAKEAAPEPDTSHLTPLAKQLLSFAKNKTVPQPPTVADLGFDMDDVTADLAQKSQEYDPSLERLNHHRNCVQWVQQRAGEILMERSNLPGSNLFDGALRVEENPDLNYAVVFVCSATAPFTGKDGAIIKHDYRANGDHVNVSHSDMVKMDPKNSVIRSKTIAKGSHEYYVKALKYVEGMVFKGYFVVDGRYAHETTRFFQAINRKLKEISENHYHQYLDEKGLKDGGGFRP